jgi:hypothetical protein
VTRGAVRYDDGWGYMQPALHAGHCLGAHTAPEIHTGRTFCAFPWAALLLVERLSRCIRLVGSIANLCVGAGEQKMPR